MPGIDFNQHPSPPEELVIKLTPELKPSLVQDGLVQPGLCFDTPARLFDSSLCRCTHVPDLQSFYIYLSLVFAYVGTQFVKEV
jgi:hypothetical protein